MRQTSLLLSLVLVRTSSLLMPEESTMHTRTYMAYPRSEGIWGEVLPDVQSTIVSIANQIATHEPVTLLVDTDSSVYESLNSNVKEKEARVDDLWTRDTSCIFVYDCENYSACVAEHGKTQPWKNAKLKCVGFNFNGWGGKQTHDNDANVAWQVALFSGVEFVESDLTMEGGSIEVDGEGTALATESSILIDSRNPGWSKADVEAELLRTLGIEKVIWTAGIAGRDITDGHIDFYARFTSPGVVVVALETDTSLYDYNVTRQVLEDLTGATDARGRALTVHTITNPKSIRQEWSSDDFAASYINYYVGNGFVLVPQFGSPGEDTAAVNKLKELYPDRSIETINIDPLAFGGGGIHCATQQEPEGIAVFKLGSAASIGATSRWLTTLFVCLWGFLVG